MASSNTTEVMRIGKEEVRINPTQVHVEGVEELQIKVVSEKKITLDAKYAEKYIDLPEFRGERPVNDNHVQFLYDEMASGNFNATIVVIAIAVLNDTRHKINGQHTCWAVWSLAQQDPNFKLTGVKEMVYLCESEEQLRKLYATFDRLLARSDKHVTQIHLVDTPEFQDLAPSVIKLLIPGLSLWLFEKAHDRKRYKPEQIAALAKQHSDTFRRVAKFWSRHGNDALHLKRRAVLAALFATFDKDKKDQYTGDFWSEVVHGVKFDGKTDPRYILREFLRNSSLRASDRKARIVEEEDMFRICTVAWNKWRAGEQQRIAYRTTNSRIKLK